MATTRHLQRESRRYALRVRILGRLGAWLLRSLAATWRIRTTGPDPFARDEPFVGALFHHSILVGAACFRDRGIAVSISRSRDGDLVDAVVARLGFAESPRGSTSSGASELLRDMIRRGRGGTTVVVPTDGPRGPACVVKPGVIALAGAAGLPLVTGAIWARPAKRFGSWDGTLLPLPFARVRIHYGDPIAVPKRPRGKGLEGLRSRVERELLERETELAGRLAGPGAAAMGPGPAGRSEQAEEGQQ